MKCSWVKFKWEEVSISGVKCSWVKWSEGLSNGVSTIIRKYTYQMMFAACMAVSFAGPSGRAV